MASSVEAYNEGGYYATLLIGEDERNSAKRKRQNDYKQDLELQMREKHAARQREKLQDMSVNASGWLDPEKGPERLKPLGSHDFLTTRRVRDSRAKPYHTLFALDQPNSGAYPSMNVHDPGMASPMIMSTSAPGNLAPPLTITQSSPRPVVINQQPIDTGPSPRYNPFQNNSGFMEMKSVLQMSMLENEKIRSRLDKENADHKRRLDRDREAELRRQRDLEAEHRRRMEELRREEDRRRLQAERDRREAERFRLLSMRQTKQDYAPSPDVRVIRPTSPNLHNLDLYRQQLREERRKLEDLLNRKIEVKKDIDLRVIKQKKQQVSLPHTPQTADLANRQNVAVFTNLKHRDMPYRQVFRAMFPEVPHTNKKLEWQQATLLKQQEDTLRGLKFQSTSANVRYDSQDRKKWLEMYPWTPNITKAHYSRINTARSLDDRCDGGTLRLQNHGSLSRETLQDDTWLRPSTANI